MSERRGDRDLADAMRELIRTGAAVMNDYTGLLSVSGSIQLTEEQAQAVDEVDQ